MNEGTTVMEGIYSVLQDLYIIFLCVEFVILCPSGQSLQHVIMSMSSLGSKESARSIHLVCPNT